MPNSPTEVIDGRLTVADSLNSVIVRPLGRLRLGMPVGQVNAESLLWDGGGELSWQLGPTGVAVDSGSLVLSGALTRGVGGELGVVLDPDSDLPVTAQSYTLIEFDSTDTQLTDFTLVHNGLLADRDYQLQMSGSALILELEALDPVFSDRFEPEPVTF